MPNYVVMHCQKFEILNGDKVYPYYLGALDAKELKKISDAPSFGYETPNHQIAAEVLVPPTQHWQRPLKTEKVMQIAQRFDMESEIMPNPVLLAVNPDKQISLAQDLDGNNRETGLWTIRIEIPESSSEQKPLWIIDGQHRVMGMAETQISKSPLPFVLLYSNQEAYRPAVLAKIFAQVTTEATPLHAVHQAWMQFVFNLGDYSEDTPTWRAMKTAALLCSTQQYGAGSNPFYGKIGFNPELAALSINPGGFSYDAKYLQDLLKEKYFKFEGSPHTLSENEVASQISEAIQALKICIQRDADRTAFFGDSRSEQKYFRDGFIAGVCAFLIENGKSRNWTEVLNKLNFQNTDWDVASSWVNSTSGTAGTISKRVAFNCFEDVFRNGELPESVETLTEYLQGKGAVLKIEYRLVDSEERPIKNSGGLIEVELYGGISKITKDIPSNARWIKITSPSINTGPVEIRLKEKPYDSNYYFAAFRKGKLFAIPEIGPKKRITLNIKGEFYGDVTVNKELTINVRD